MSGLTTEQYNMLKRLRDDLPFYSSKCLKIVDKLSGKLVPFVFNRAQAYLHERIEEQRKRTGKVRAVVIKGRQFGGCFSPEMRVLTSDYRWVAIDRVALGDKLIAIDEFSPKEKGKRRKRRMLRETVVEAKAERYDDMLELVLDNGAVLKCTGNHRHLCRKRGGDDMQWRATQDMKVGDQVRFLTRPPRYAADVEDGWFSGLLDGEGCYAKKKSGGLSLQVSQVPGPILDRAKRYLDSRGFFYAEKIDARVGGSSSKFGGKPVHSLFVNQIGRAIELLAIARPIRFADRKPWLGCTLPHDSLAKVVSIRALGFGRVIDIQTSEKTFICEGVVTHNSTYVAARYFQHATMRPGTTVFILAHIASSTAHLFGMARRFYANAPTPLLPGVDKDNERNLVFAGIGSSYDAGTAGSAEIGRSFTVRRLHLSEVAFYEHADEIASGLLQAVPDAPDTEVIIESTAKMAGDYFHKKVLSGLAADGDYITIFIPWFWQPEYNKTPPPGFVLTPEEEDLKAVYALTDSQLYWRRVKIEDEFNGDAWRFRREYPMTISDAFSLSGESLVSAQKVIEARACKSKDPNAPLVAGCDPARNRDKTVITYRRGREIVKVKRFSEMDEMTLAGVIATDIETMNVDKFFIDTGGGYGTIDRLKELGYGNVVTGVHFGGAAMRDDLFANKGAEMADAVREWFDAGGANIPDEDEIQTDILMIPPLKQSGSRGRLCRVNKDKLREDYGRSPDFFDSLSLTFAFPVCSRITERRVKRPVFDSRRASSPLTTVRDFNRVPKDGEKIFKSEVKIL